MKLSVVIPVLNQIDLAKTCYLETRKNSSLLTTEFIILDNGSDVPIKEEDFPDAYIFRNEINIGVYPTFKEGVEIATGDVVVFLHSDVVIWEKGWDVRIIKSFEENGKLGLIGFVGSSEIDNLGGRGGGTGSNFQGKEINDGNKVWKGSSWEKHGKHITGSMKSAVVDGCVMILKRDAWNSIEYRKDFPPHHFYDRLISTQILEKGWQIETLGIEFDHISGQTVNQEKKYQKMAKDWYLKTFGIITNAEIKRFTGFDKSPEDIQNWDEIIYKLAEDMWLSEYRDTKHFIPIKI